jgi:hypothetical protein
LTTPSCTYIVTTNVYFGILSLSLIDGSARVVRRSNVLG